MLLSNRPSNEERPVETDLYMMGHRYYDPEIGRFISLDDVEHLDPTKINGLNLYAYCNNDPVNYADNDGHVAVLFFLAGLGISTLIGAIVGATAYTISESFSYSVTGNWSWSWAEFVGNTMGGALGGALSFITPAAPSVLIGGLTAFSSTAFSMLLQNQREKADYTKGQRIFSSLVSGVIAAAMTGISDAIKIPGLNIGRNSYSAISKQIVTKFRSGAISRITYSTFSKMLTYNLTGNLIGSFVSGGMDILNISDVLSNFLGDWLSW